MSDIAIYTNSSGHVEVTIEQDSVWLNLNQLSLLFQRDKSVISRHIRNIFIEHELERVSVVANFATTANDGKNYQVEHFNLDVIISIGYRVKSQEGVRFRQWATHLLKQHLTQGYTINQQRLQENSHALEAALRLVKRTAESQALTLEAGRGLVDIITRYTHTFLWLQRYDEGLLSEPTGTMGGQLAPLDVARHAISVLKSDLIAKGEASPLFGIERDEGLAAIWGNLEQSVFGEAAYPSIEAKAAHLLYFIIKNHPLTDGNKRTAAFLFVDFLHRNQRLFDENGTPIINDIGLAALALLVAESRPDDKDILIKLIMTMLSTATLRTTP
ncbi:virulence protein RhuM/Fic/DOC family protein [Agitococcus lubricus]|uniref:Fic/DOC family protein n=1 Tax=Agitococcus lubricus TaxID=1077255 RepID=A0A2T5J3V5_9GAMM|nr:virulence protein RhuM/Fic/DOC family protein [Agitococcus lubricus]PTQ91295.1 Fic/DOC family protein [Agitococcus lubricus]